MANLNNSFDYAIIFDGQNEIIVLKAVTPIQAAKKQRFSFLKKAFRFLLHGRELKHYQSYSILPSNI